VKSLLSGLAAAVKNDFRNSRPQGQRASASHIFQTDIYNLIFVLFNY
jgi:hypothetical protein